MMAEVTARYRHDVATEIVSTGVVAILRCASADEAIERGRVMVDAGIRVLEVSLTTPDALRAVRSLAALDALVGAGTVLSAAGADASIRAGARFLVSPNVDVAVISTAHRHGAAAIPGAQTPTEAIAALEAGADLVKIFPAGALGLGWLRAVHEALPYLPLVPTGGVGLDEVDEWCAAGAAAVGLGRTLTSGDLDDVRERSTLLLRSRRGQGAQAH